MEAPNTNAVRPDCTEALTRALSERILIIDGAMGTAIQRDRPDEAGYRGERVRAGLIRRDEHRAGTQCLRLGDDGRSRTGSQCSCEGRYERG